MDKFASISIHLHYLSFLLLIRPFVVVFFLIGSVSALANPGSVVFNSFQDRSLALRESVEISRKFGIETRIEEAMVNGFIYHRVLTPVMDQTSAREVIRQARTSGLDDVWVLSWKELPAVRTKRRSPEREATVAPGITGLPNSRPQSVAYAPQERNDELAMSARVVNADSLSTGQSATMRIARVEDANVKIDGLVDESIWSEIPVLDQMKVINPDTLEKSRYSTKIKIFSDNKGLYVSADMEQPKDTLVERLTTRDESVNSDTFYVMIDTSGEGLYGYNFGLSLGGSKQDGKIAPERVMSFEWDGPWTGETAVTDNGWSAEMFLPWSAMSMPGSADDRRIGLLTGRKVAHLDELWGWPYLPFSKPRFLSGFSPALLEGVNPKQQWEIYPYVSAASDEIRNEADGRGGVDVAWRPSSNLQLTATVNPDFGSVESDDVVVNLTAYETFFPEKRLFFLEGNEVFVTTPRSVTEMMSSGPRGSGGRQSPSPYGMEPTTLLNTRRIGGSAKQVAIPEGVTVSGVEQSKPSELIGAVKAVGQSGGLRYGLLTAFEKEAELYGVDEATGEEVIILEDGRDFGVARVLYERVAGGGRTSFGYMGTLASNPLDEAVVHGVDAHWLSKSGKFSWDTQFISSDVDDDIGYGFFTDLNISPRQGSTHTIKIDALDDRLDISDLGFLRRNDLYSVSYMYNQLKSQGIRPRFRNRNLGFFAMSAQNEDGFTTQSYIGVWNGFLFRDNSELDFSLEYVPSRYDDRNSRGNGAYRLSGGHYLRAAYGTSTANKFATSIQLVATACCGSDKSFTADIGFTYRPVDRFAFDFDIGFEKEKNWLVHMGDRNITAFDSFALLPSLSMDYFISAKQQLRLKLQWIGLDADESQYWLVPQSAGRLLPRTKMDLDPKDDFTVSQMTVQLRYRWEIAPLSDLFIVYTRGAHLPSRSDQDFDYLFRDALSEPIIDVFTMKLRYRFGS